MTTSFTDKKAVTTVSPEARDAWFKWQLTPPVPTSWELPEEAREDFEDAIMLLLLTGEDASEYADYLNDCLEEFLGESQVKGDFYHDIEQYAQKVVRERRALAERLGVTGDSGNLAAAFADLEAHGVLARGKFSCCGTCASAEIWDEREGSDRWKGYIYYHQQDAENLAESGSTYIGFGSFEAYPSDEEAWKKLSDEQRAAGARPVSEREVTWDVDNAVLRDGEPSVAAAWASMRLASSAGWWEPQEASALERWARAQAALAGGDAQVSVYEASAPGSGDADGRLIDMRGQGLDCRVRTARTLSGENQVQVADASGVQTLPVSELMDRVKGVWPDTATQALDQRAETVARQQNVTSLGPVSREPNVVEQARAAMLPALDRVERMVGANRIIVDGPSLEEVVSSSGVRSIAPSVVLRPADAPTDDERAVLISLKDPHFPSTETAITPREGAQVNPYIPERVQAAADLGIQPQLFDAVQATIGDGLANAQYAAMHPSATESIERAAQSTIEVAASQTRAEVPELTVYTKPDCPGCTMTKRELDKAGATYQEVDLTTRPDLVEAFTAEGLRSAPVVELGEQRIAGFNPAKIRAIAAQAMSPTPPTAPAPAGASTSKESTPPPQQERQHVRGEAR